MPRVMVVGERGFLGRHIVKAFENTVSPNTKINNLLFRSDIVAGLNEAEPDVLINAAAKVGGILANRTRPAEFYHENIIMGTHLIQEAHEYGIKKFVQIGTVCSYPQYAPIPLAEENFWNGRPEINNGAYGQAKRALIDLAQAFAAQYDFNVICPVLANLYGPGDHYEEDRSHVIPAMIRKFSEAVEHGDKSIVFWGTGKCTREFLYVEDAARAIKFLTERYNSPEIINVSSGYEIRICDLAELIAKKIGFSGSIHWDHSKPDGVSRRHMDTFKMEHLGWSAQTSLAEGISQAVEDYKKNRREIAA